MNFLDVAVPLEPKEPEFLSAFTELAIIIGTGMVVAAIVAVIILNSKKKRKKKGKK